MILIVLILLVLCKCGDTVDYLYIKKFLPAEEIRRVPIQDDVPTYVRNLMVPKTAWGLRRTHFCQKSGGPEVHQVFREHITINICVKDFWREHTFVKSPRGLMESEGTHYYQHMCEVFFEGTHFCQKSEGPEVHQVFRGHITINISMGYYMKLEGPHDYQHIHGTT